MGCDAIVYPTLPGCGLGACEEPEIYYKLIVKEDFKLTLVEVDRVSSLESILIIIFR